MNNYLNTILEQASIKLEQEKQRLVQLRIEERVYEKININKEITKRFPKVIKIFHSNDTSEHWYYDNGSKDGLHLISFYPQDNNDVFDKNYKLTIGFNYK